MTHDTLIEGILFLHPEGITRSELRDISGLSEVELSGALESLRNIFATRAIALVESSDRLTLAARPEVASLMLTREEERLSADLTGSALEVLAIILYRTPATQAQIDYLRGVRSHGITKLLVLRGLVEKKQEGDRTIYTPSVELLAELGVTHASDLPSYETILERATEILTAS